MSDEETGMSRVDATGVGGWMTLLMRGHRPGVALPAGVLRRSAAAAVVVGTVLTALNQGDLLLSGSFPAALWWKIPLTYVVPFLVATYGALAGRGSKPS